MEESWVWCTLACSNFPDRAGNLQALTNQTTIFSCGAGLVDPGTFRQPPLTIRHGAGCLDLVAVSFGVSFRLSAASSGVLAGGSCCNWLFGCSKGSFMASTFSVVTGFS